MKHVLIPAALLALVLSLALWWNSPPVQTEQLAAPISLPTSKAAATRDEDTRAEVPLEPAGQSDPFLVKVEEALGPLPQLRPDYDSKGQAVWWATSNQKPQAPTRMQAILEGVPAHLVPKVLDCFNSEISAGSLPSNFLHEPLEEVAVIRDPVAQEWIDDLALYSLGDDHATGQMHFQRVLLSKFAPYLRPPKLCEKYYSGINRYNPNGAEITPEAGESLAAIEAEYFPRIKALIQDEAMLEDYLLARELKLAEGDYIAIPFNAVQVLSGCLKVEADPSNPIRQTVGATAGWTVALTIEPGYAPVFDARYAELVALWEQREAELKALIAGL